MRDQHQARDCLGERRRDGVAGLGVLLLDGAVERPVGGEALQDQGLLNRVPFTSVVVIVGEGWVYLHDSAQARPCEPSQG